MKIRTIHGKLTYVSDRLKPILFKRSSCPLFIQMSNVMATEMHNNKKYRIPLFISMSTFRTIV